MMTTLLNVNGDLTRGLTLQLRTCTAVVATRARKKRDPR
jgi:hypothetical protein